MEHFESSSEEVEYSIDLLVALECKIQEKNLTPEEEDCLREVLKSGTLPQDQEQRLIALLNPSKMPVLSLSADQQKEYQICSHGTNYRIHVPAVGRYDPSTIVFNRKTGLYYIKSPEGTEILE